MSLGLQNATNLAIQLRNIFSQELPLLAQLGENWNLYGMGPGQFRVWRRLSNTQILALPTNHLSIIPTPATNALILPTFAWMRLTWTANYTNINAACTMQLGYEVEDISPLGWLNEGGVGREQVSNLLAAGNTSDAFFCPLQSAKADDQTFAISSEAIFGTPFIKGEGIEIQADNDSSNAFTGGNAANLLDVVVNFQIVTVP